MKRIYLLLMFVSISLFSLAQDEPADRFRTLKNEVSFGIMGAGDIRQSPYAVPGIGYKRFMENGAIRVLVGGSVNSSTSGGGGFSNIEQEAGAVTRIGYQYHVMLGRFMPMIGIDASGGYYTYGWSSGAQNNSKTETVSFGLSPNLGLEFWISPKLSFFIDTRFDVAYLDTRSNSTYQTGWPSTTETTKTRSSGINTTIAPISSFMCAFHF